MLWTIYSSAYEEALRRLRSGCCKQEILGFLAREAENASGADTTVSILVVDENGLLRNGASPHLPADYLRAIDGLKPHPNVGTCAAAAATGHVVFTPSFYADNKWSELRHWPTSLGYVGAWSYPIKNDANKVLGTFGTYFRQHREPSDEEVKGTALLASVAALAIAGES